MDQWKLFTQRAANGEPMAHCVLLELRRRIRSEGKEPMRFHRVSS